MNSHRHGKRPENGTRRRQPDVPAENGVGTQYMLVAMAVVEIAGLVYLALAA